MSGIGATRSLSTLTLAVPLLAGLVATGPAQEPPPGPAPHLRPFPCGSRIALEQIWQVLRRHDRDGDGRVTPQEYGRSEVRFRDFDRNGDGALSAADFPPGMFLNGFNPWLVRMADRDRNSVVTRAEWLAMADRLDPDEDGTITPAEFAAERDDARENFALYLLSFDQDWDGKFTRGDLDIAWRDLDVDGDGVLQGREVERWRSLSPRPRGNPPRVGDPAPDFELPRADDPEQRVRLSSFVGTRPVALVFGSYT